MESFGTASNLRACHESHSARFVAVNGVEVVNDYGDSLREYCYLQESAGVIDLSSRGRLCVAGADRKRFLHGQVTNDINRLQPGEGCYAAITNAKGKMVADANIYCLEDELLLDIEPGLTPTTFQRLDKYIIADDVQLLDVSGHYGMVSIQGPKAASVVRQAAFDMALPEGALTFKTTSGRQGGDIYCMRHDLGSVVGYDLFVPADSVGRVLEQSAALAKEHGGGLCGWQALETARIEAGIPRFNQDMDETNLAPETGIEPRAISYSKGCYIGQEVIARVRTYGQVAKALRGLRLAGNLRALPAKGDKLYIDQKEVGHVTSAVYSPRLQANIALGYVRREHNQAGEQLIVRTPNGDSPAVIVDLPFGTGPAAG